MSGMWTGIFNRQPHTSRVMILTLLALVIPAIYVVGIFKGYILLYGCWQSGLGVLRFVSADCPRGSPRLYEDAVEATFLDSWLEGTSDSSFWQVNLVRLFIIGNLVGIPIPRLDMAFSVSMSLYGWVTLRPLFHTVSTFAMQLQRVWILSEELALLNCILVLEDLGITVQPLVVDSVFAPTGFPSVLQLQRRCPVEAGVTSLLQM